MAPYSPRARVGAPVAMPLDWKEVKPGLDSAGFNVRAVPGLLARRKDPWADIDALRQRRPIKGP